MIERNGRRRLRRRRGTKSAELIEADPMGTIPHSLVLVIGDTVEALRAFHEVIDPKVRRVALIDTLQDEKFEAIRVAEAWAAISMRCGSTPRRRGAATCSASWRRSAGSSTIAASSTSS